MKRCQYCGRENKDTIEFCAECGTSLAPQPPPLGAKGAALVACSLLGRCIGIYPENLPKRTPIFGPLALAAPFVGVGWASVGSQTKNFGPGDMQGWGALVYMFLVVFCALIVGGIAALIGLSRAEKFRGLGWTGLVINFGPVLVFFLDRWMRKD